MVSATLSPLEAELEDAGERAGGGGVDAFEVGLEAGEVLAELERDCDGLGVATRVFGVLKFAAGDGLDADRACGVAGARTVRDEDGQRDGDVDRNRVG